MLERCREPIGAKDSHQDRLFPNSPGFDSDRGFRYSLVFDDRDQRTIAQSSSRLLKALPMAAHANRIAAGSRSCMGRAIRDHQAEYSDLVGRFIPD
jgi:hypothetical protein